MYHCTKCGASVMDVDGLGLCGTCAEQHDEIETSATERVSAEHVNDLYRAYRDADRAWLTTYDAVRDLDKQIKHERAVLRRTTKTASRDKHYATLDALKVERASIMPQLDALLTASRAAYEQWWPTQCAFNAQYGIALDD